MKRILLTTILFILGLFCFWQGKANSDINLRLTEPKVRLTIAPGQSKSGQMAIENPAEQGLQVRCYLEDWFYTPGGDGGKEFRLASTTPLSCASWINFSPAEFSLKPYDRQLINYRVSVPPTARGGHYAVLFFETIIGETKDEQGLNVLILGRIGALFYVQPEGTVKKEAILKDIAIKEEEEGFKVTAIFKNIGNVDITAAGNFNLIDKNGLVFARGEFNEAYTLPQDEVFLQAVWEKKVELGIYDLVITLDLGERSLVEEREATFSPGKTEVLRENR